MYYTLSDGLKLYYEEKGNLHAEKTLVFLNGLSQSTLAWAFTTPAFEEEHHIVLLDFIFQGQSDKDGDWRNFNRHAADVKELLDHLKLNKPHIIGLSYGSLVAQHMGILYPGFAGSYILMSTFAHKIPYFEAIEHAWWKALEHGGYPLLLDIMLPSVLGEDYFKNPLIPIELMKQTRKDLNPDAQALLKLMRATKERGDMRKDLSKIKEKTLIIHGEKDLLLPWHLAQSVHEHIPGSQFSLIPSVGHTLNLEAIPQTVKLIGEFV